MCYIRNSSQSLIYIIYLDANTFTRVVEKRAVFACVFYHVNFEINLL